MARNFRIIFNNDSYPVRIFEDNHDTMKETVQNAVSAGVSLQNANLRQQDLTGIILRNADLRGANLTLTHLGHTIFIDCNFHGARMLQVGMDHSVCHVCDFTAANLEDASLLHFSADRCSFISAQMQGVDMNFSNVAGSDFTQAILHRVTCNFCNFYRVDMTQASLHASQFKNSFFGDAIFKETALSWGSHDIIAAILRSHAGQNRNRRKLAAIVLGCRDTCWDGFLRQDHPEKKWALKTLLKYPDSSPTGHNHERLERALKRLEEKEATVERKSS